MRKKSVNLLSVDHKENKNLLKIKHSTLPYKKGNPLFRKPKIGNHPQW